MKDDKNVIKYLLTIEYNPDSDEIESIQEEIIENEPKPIMFLGKGYILDYMDDTSIGTLNSFVIAET